MSLTNNNNVGSTDSNPWVKLSRNGYISNFMSNPISSAINPIIRQQLANKKLTMPDLGVSPIIDKNPNIQYQLKNKELTMPDLGKVKPPRRINLQKSLSSVGNFIGNNPQLVGMALDGLGNSFNSNVENSEAVSTIFGVGDSVANALSAANPAAGMTAKFAMAGFKGLNNLGGSRTETFYTNQDTIKNIGGSYGGSVNDINQAASKSNKKYGLFSLGSKNSANELIREARRQQNIMTNISEENQDLQARVNDLSGLFYNMQLNGGVPQLRSAKLGAKINFIKSKNLFKHTINLDTRQVEEFKQGGIIDSKEEWEPIIELPVEEFKEGGNITWEPVLNYDFIPEFQEGGNFPQEYIDFINDVKEHSPNLGQLSPEGYNMYRSWELNGKPRTFEEGLQENMFSLHMDGTYHGNTIAWNKETNEGEWLKHKNYKTSWMEKAFYDGYTWEQDEKGNPIFSDDQPLYEGVRPILKKLTGEELEKSEKFRSQYDLVEDSNGWRKYVPKKFKQGGSIKESETPKIEETTQKNLIPEGALHKNKHHMENDENITKKGIPVIDNDGDQQAEIEKDEWTMTLELTKTIEDLYHKFYNEDTKNSEKDQLAIQAGNIIVEQLLYNTDDRTNLIKKIDE